MSVMTVFFEDPFWVAVLETTHAGRVRATRHVFGPEPTDAELYLFLLCHGVTLLARAERSVAAPDTHGARPAIRNPKRLAREAARAARQPRPSTSAQDAIRLEMERRAEAADRSGRARRAERAEHRRQVRVARARARHRGH